MRYHVKSPALCLADLAKAQGELLQAIDAASKIASYENYAMVMAAYRVFQDARKAVALYRRRCGGAEKAVLERLMQSPDQYVEASMLPNRYGGYPARWPVLHWLVSMNLVETHFDFYRITDLGKQYWEEIFKPNPKKMRHNFLSKLRRAGVSLEDSQKAAYEYYKQLVGEEECVS